MDTRNPLLDALLSKKYEEASRKGVMVYFDLPDLRDMPMGQTDLVIVLSNLLNNAIEAAAQADPPEIYVRMPPAASAGKNLTLVSPRLTACASSEGVTIPGTTSMFFEIQ